MPVTLAGAAVGLAVASTAVNVYGQYKAAQAEEEAAEQNRRVARVERVQMKRRARQEIARVTRQSEAGRSANIAVAAASGFEGAAPALASRSITTAEEIDKFIINQNLQTSLELSRLGVTGADTRRFKIGAAADILSGGAQILSILDRRK